MERLKRRQDFVAAAKASYAAMPGLTVQARDRQDGKPPRLGFTATKKLGNAVVRNRVKRRLRELARQDLAPVARTGHDYVVIGRAPAFDRAWGDLQADLISALKRLHRAKPPGKDTP